VVPSTRVANLQLLTIHDDETIKSHRERASDDGPKCQKLFSSQREKLLKAKPSSKVFRSN